MKMFLFAVLGAAWAPPLAACDLCSVYAANEARGEIGRGLFAGVAAQFTHFGTLQEDGHKVPNDAHQSLDSSITQLLLGYNFTERLGLQVSVPIIYRSFQRADGFDIDRGTESGLGEVSLLGHSQLARGESKNGTFAWNILGGVKFPTGSTRRLHEEVDELTAPPPPPGAPDSGIHGHDLTLGSVSFDGIVGTSVFARYKRAFIGASAQYAIRTQGDFGYQFANDLTWSGGPGALLILKDRYTLSLQANVSGETKGKDDFNGGKADDTGITSV